MKCPPFIFRHIIKRLDIDTKSIIAGEILHTEIMRMDMIARLDRRVAKPIICP